MARNRKSTKEDPDLSGRPSYLGHIMRHRHGPRRLSDLHQQELHLPNPFATWVEEHSIDLKELAIATGIRPYKLKEMCTGLVAPTLAQAIELELVTRGAFPVTRWATQPRIESELKEQRRNQGQPMKDWVAHRVFGDGLFVRDNVRLAMEQAYEIWRKLKEAEDAPEEPTLASRIVEAADRLASQAGAP